MVTIDEAKRLTLKQLANLGRFDLRVLSDKAGLAPLAFCALNNEQAATALYKDLHKDTLPTWYDEEWVKDLFERIPELCSLSERSTRNLGRHPYKYVMCVRSAERTYVHMVLNAHEFDATFIFDEIKKLLSSSDVKNSRWLDSVPSASEITRFVNRHDYLLEEKAPFRKEVEQEEYEDEVRAHGYWMRAAFKAYPEITRFVKAPNRVISPTTFAIVLDDRHAWMKAPTFDKICRRMKPELRECGRYDGRPLWVEGAPEGYLVFTKEELDKRMHELGMVTKDGVESYRAIPEEPEEQTHCACGSELRSNKVYAVAAQPGQSTKCCGECAAKGDPMYNERTALVASRKVYLEPPTKVRATKFDPRPGIDDRGAWSSPSWEEDYS